MVKKLLPLLITIISINCYSQISYEKGHFIDNSNKKVNCLIKNSDWANNPTEFEYKLSENSEAKKINTTSVKEFEIYKISKYSWYTVNIDRSTENFDHMTNNRNPVFEEEQLFLKVLVEGEANLYSYEEGNLKRYFYNKEDSNIEQLIFKSFRTYNDKLGKNTQYKQQLFNNFKCATIDIKKIESLEYRKNSLVKFFIEYNTCNNSSFINYEVNQEKDLFNLTIRPRLNSSSLSIQNPISNLFDTEFKNKFGFGIGIELEVIFPFNKNKWAILIEAAYQNYESEILTTSSRVAGTLLSTKVEYSSVEIPIGLRHYFFINDNSKIFTNISVIFDASSNSNIIMETANGGNNLKTLDITNASNLAFGVGYKLNDTYSIEMRLQTSRNVLDAYTYWDSDYNTFTIIFGYSFF